MTGVNLRQDIIQVVASTEASFTLGLMQSTSHSLEDWSAPAEGSSFQVGACSRLYAYGEPAEGSFTLGPMQSTSHSVEDWSRVGSAKGAQRGLTRADAANLTMVSIFERHTTPPSPRAVSRQRGSTPRGDHLSDLLSSSLHLGLRDPEHGTHEANLRKGLVTCTCTVVVA